MKHVFVTQSNGTNAVKSPIGMFDDLTIDNDLKMVIDRHHSYYNE